MESLLVEEDVMFLHISLQELAGPFGRVFSRIVRENAGIGCREMYVCCSSHVV